jgi:hypothetical protein
LSKEDDFDIFVLIQSKRVSTVFIGAAKRIVNDTDVVFDGQSFPFVFAAEYAGHPPDRYLDGVLIKRGDSGDCVEARGNIFEKECLFRLAGLGYEDARRGVFGKNVAVRFADLEVKT